MLSARREESLFFTTDLSCRFEVDIASVGVIVARVKTHWRHKNSDEVTLKAALYRQDFMGCFVTEALSNLINTSPPFSVTQFSQWR